MFKQLLSVLLCRSFPVISIAMDGIWNFFPHKGGVQAGWRLGGVKKGGTGTPGHWRREPSLFVRGNDLLKLSGRFEPENDHERRIVFVVGFNCGVNRRLVKHHVNGKQRG